MAKVSTLKFEFKGQSLAAHVNCTSAGQFNCNLPDEVAEALRIDKKIKADTLVSLEKLFFEALDKYKKAETKEELFILIAYYARGYFTKDKQGRYMWGGYRHKYDLEVNFDTPKNAIGLDFIVGIKQTIDKKEKWFNAKLGKDCSHIQKEEYSQPDVWHKQGVLYHPDKYKIIPFSEIALESLKNASEKIRAASETLFNFIEQDEEKIFLTLTSQKLLQ